MITFFTVPRAFTGEFDDLQRMAITSWLGAVPGCQVILMGGEAGAYETAVDLGVDWIGDLQTNEHGTPIVAGAFGLAEEYAAFDLLCEISADIVLAADIDAALGTIRNVERPFVVGQRLDIDPGRDAGTATLHDPAGIDYFIYRKGMLGEIPPFAVGRTAYDNWLVWAAVEEWGLTVIDATEAITAIHVNHGYPGFNSKAAMRAGAETKENRRIMRESGGRLYGVTHAPYVLNGKGVTPRE